MPTFELQKLKNDFFLNNFDGNRGNMEQETKIQFLEKSLSQFIFCSRILILIHFLNDNINLMVLKIKKNWIK